MAFGHSQVLMDDRDVKTDWMLVKADARIYIMGPRWNRRRGHGWRWCCWLGLAAPFWWRETERSTVYPLPPTPSGLVIYWRRSCYICVMYLFGAVFILFWAVFIHAWSFVE